MMRGEFHITDTSSFAAASNASFARSSQDIVSRILLASSRTFSGGDSYTVLYDLFGSPDVVMKPSLSSAHQAVIEIDVKAGRVDVVCKCYYDIFDQER